VGFARKSRGYSAMTEAGRTKSNLVLLCIVKKTQQFDMVWELLIIRTALGETTGESRQTDIT
jgi:hypothetical protein